MIDRRDALAAVAVLLLLPTAADALDRVWLADARGCKVLLDVEKADEVGVQWSGCLRRTPGQLRPPISVGANDCPRSY